jgi:hypothetical protein
MNQERKLHHWRGEELKFIRDNWRTVSDKELAARFGVTINAMRLRRLYMGIRRPINTSGLQPPKHWNAHKKQKPFWITDHGKRYLNIVVYEEGKTRRPMRYARYLWIQRNGPVPPGMVVAALNGDINDTREDNLALMTRSQLGSLMQSRRPSELCRAIRAKQVKTLRARKIAAAYKSHTPYQFAA